MGNELRGDDGVGIFIGRALENKGFKVIFAYASPENVLTELKGFEQIIIVDAAHFNKDVPFLISKELDFSNYSHKIGLKTIQKFVDSNFLFFGVKTYKRVFDTKISEKALENARKTIKVIEMCMAVPGIIKDFEKKVIEINGKDKKAKFAVPNLKEGDFVLVHASVVIEKLSKEEYDDLVKGALCFS